MKWVLIYQRYVAAFCKPKWRCSTKIDRIRRELSSGDTIDYSVVQELDNKTCSNGMLAKLIQRDVVDNWNARKTVLE